MLAVPPVGDGSVVVLVMQLPDSQDLAITALNYGRSNTSVQVDLTLIPPGIPAFELAGQVSKDIIAGQDANPVTETGMLQIDLESLAGKTLVVVRKPTTGGS
jgi:hypothetical protein